jgi:hypothetical protein
MKNKKSEIKIFKIDGDRIKINPIKMNRIPKIYFCRLQ